MADKLDYILYNSGFKMELNELHLKEKYQGRKESVKVSVIMPTWDRASVIERAIESVLNQTYRNFELIISDDGSTDGTEDILKSRYSGETRIQYLKNNHSGVSRARNAAISRSSGNLIAYLDTDNIWSENYLLLMVNTFVDHPEIETLYCAIRFLDTTNKRDFILYRDFDRNALLERNFIDLNVFIHKKSLIQQVGGFNEDLKTLEDWDFIIRCTEHLPPYSLECCLATYYLEEGIDHLTMREDVLSTYHKIKEKLKST